MRYYFLIMIWLVAGTGYASSVRNTPNVPAASPVDVNSSGDAAFDELEKELSQRQVTVPDPIEPWNRTMFGINDIFYLWIAKPVIQTYEKAVPRPARVCVGNSSARHDSVYPSAFVVRHWMRLENRMERRMSTDG